MALFFDTDWFDTRLKGLGLTRTDAATALGLSPVEIDEMWKDQRQLSVKDVRLLSALLGSDVKEISERAGLSTPGPRGGADMALLLKRVDAMDSRLERLERMMEEIKKLLLRK